MIFKKTLITLSVSLLLASNSFAMSKDEEILLSKLNKDFPKLNIYDVVYLPDVNLYELHSKNNTLLTYTNTNIDYFYSNGIIVDIKNKKNVTAIRENLNIQRFLKNLPKNKAITIKYGTGERKIAIFTDPLCPFCKKTDIDIHTNLKKENITFYYFMNPLNIPGHEQAPLIADKIWCSSNKEKSWKEWIFNNKIPSNEGNCSTPTKDTKTIAEAIGFNSTPTLIFDNGVIWKGQISSTEIMNIINKATPDSIK